VNHLRRRPHRISDIDIDVERDARLRKGTAHAHPDAGVLVLITDDVRRRTGHIEDDAIVEFDSGYSPHHGQDNVSVVGDVNGKEVDISRRAACAESGKKSAAFEDQTVAVLTAGKSDQESFQDVQVEEFLGRALSRRALFCRSR